MAFFEHTSPKNVFTHCVKMMTIIFLVDIFVISILSVFLLSIGSTFSIIIGAINLLRFYILFVIIYFIANKDSFLYRHSIALCDIKISTIQSRELLENDGLNKFRISHDFVKETIYIHCRSKEDLMGAKCLLSDYLKS